MKYFPGTTAEEIKSFKSHYPPFILKQLEKDDFSIFKQLNLTDELLAEIEQLVDSREGEGVFYDILLKVCFDKSADLKTKRPPIIRYLLDKDKLRLNRSTVLALLNFDLDPYNRENQALELEAFYALREKGYGKLRELVVGVVEQPPDKVISLNAVYVFKYIN